MTVFFQRSENLRNSVRRGKSLTDGQKWSSGEAFSIHPRLSEDALFRGKTSYFALTPFLPPKTPILAPMSAIQNQE